MYICCLIIQINKVLLKKTEMISNRKLIYTGCIIPLIFWIGIGYCGLITENYSFLANQVSDLGSIGTETQTLFTFTLVFISVLSIIFIYGLYKTAKKTGLNIIPILLILTYSVSIFGAGIFPLPLPLHGILGSPSMLLPLSPLLSILLWKESKIAGIKIASGLILLIMFLGFLTLMPDILTDYFGLKQRFFHLGWSLWFIYLSLKFTELDRKTNAS